MVSRQRLMMCAALAAVAFAPVVGRASNEKTPTAETKHADAKPTEVKPSEAKPSEAKPSEAKPSAAKPTDVKAGEAKGEGKAKPAEAQTPEGKVPGAKADAKADPKTDLKADAKAKDGNAGSEKDGEGEESAGKAAKPTRKKKSSASKEPAKIPGEGPSPASPPPLNMGGLRDEVRREGSVSKIDAAASPRTKVEQMLSEVVKTREALHNETVRLEGMLAQEPPEAAGSGAGPAAAGGAAAGKPAAKNPLDILAKALRGIKPEQAAPIVSRLDKRLAATVLQRMPPIDAGKIMGAMKPDTAAELATQIALRVPEAKK